MAALRKVSGLPGVCSLNECNCLPIEQIKQYQLLGGRLEQYGRMYSTAIDAAKEYLFRQVSTVPNAPLLLVGQNTGSRFEAKLEHLVRSHYRVLAISKCKSQ